MKSLTDTIEINQSDIIILTETKGKPPLIENYTWFSKERPQGKGGGIAVAVKNEIAKHTTHVDNIEDTDMEILWLKVGSAKKKSADYIGCYYGPQESCKKEEVERQYSSIATQIHTLKKTGNILLAGDFNAKLKIEETNYKQKESRNGKILRELLKETGCKAANLKSETGMWTREHRNNPNEKSTLDYILVCETMEERIKEIEVDEIGLMRMRSHNAESDHNTITIELTTGKRKQIKRTIRRWNLENEQGWVKYNSIITGRLKERNITKYEEFLETIKKTLKETVGQKTITIAERKSREDDETKTLREGVKTKRKIFKEAGREEKYEALQSFYEAQAKLREKIESNSKNTIEKKLKEIITSKNPRNEIWSIRKKLIKKTGAEYDYITENGKTITDPEETKEHLAEYYESLYQAREEKKGYEKWTKLIKDKIEEIQKDQKRENKLKEISLWEMKKVVRTLKKKKASGPDDIPNEIFIKATDETLKEYIKVLNKTANKSNTPKDWKKGTIKSIYKGKGKKGLCTNERGITLSSNIGKVYERIILNRIKPHVKISDMQGGGKEGASTAGHILLLKGMINAKNKGYAAFLDVTKAYDKAWADAIMYVLNKEGLKDRTWEKIKELNEGLTATVETKYGQSRKIKIRDSIRQGGVLSVTMYATLMDEISKEIKENNLGMETTQGEKTGCLLWMDDVALVAETKEEMQKMLDITNDIASRYRIEFGKEKSNVIAIGKSKQEKFHIGDMELQYCDHYKYLGVLINGKNNLSNHIDEVKRKAEGAYQTIMAIAGSKDLKGIEMSTIWQLLEACIIPIIMYGGEASVATKKEQQKRNQILDSILKRIMMVPITTPREILYAETGLLDIEHYIIKNKLNLAQKIEKRGSELLKQVASTNKKWKREIDVLKEKTGQLKEQSKEETKNKVEKVFNEKQKAQSLKKSKVRYYEENASTGIITKRKEYMNKCNRHQVQAVMMARSRMMKVKNNYKNMHNNLKCRFCNASDETQTHILQECQKIDRERYPSVSKEEIFEENVDKLKKVAEKISKIEELLKSVTPASNRDVVVEPS